MIAGERQLAFDDVLVSSMEKLADIAEDVWKNHPEKSTIDQLNEWEGRFLISTIKGLESTARILDAGCGFGRTMTLLSEQGFGNVFGADISVKMIRKAKTDQIISSYNYVMCDMRDSLPFQDNSFDAVLCLGSTIGNFTNRNGAIKEFNRILNENGILLLGVHNAELLEEKVATSYYNTHAPHPVKYVGLDKEQNNVHMSGLVSHWFTEQEISDLLIQNGFLNPAITKFFVYMYCVAEKSHGY